MYRRLSWPHRPLALLALAGGLLFMALPLAAQIPEPWAEYQVQGSGTIRVLSGCCAGEELDGRFEASYSVDPSGGVHVYDLRTMLFDTTIGGVGILGLGSYDLRCAMAWSESGFNGWLSGGALWFGSGTVPFAGENFKYRNADGSCPSLDASFAATNTAAWTGVHDPAGNHFTLGGDLSATVSGTVLTFRVALNGTYRNRPPVARLGLTVPGFEQGGCPAVFHAGNPSEWRVEANDSQGFRAPLRGFSWDNDASYSRSDILAEAWFHQKDANPPTPLGAGESLPPVLFPFGSTHRVTLIATDRLGAADLDECMFRVVDTTPPSVSVSLTPFYASSAPGSFTAVSATVTASDLVGPVTVRLESIVSNDPVYDPIDILDATYGTDDRAFQLARWPTGSGTKRVYRVTYRATDGAGNSATAGADFTVTVP